MRFPWLKGHGTENDFVLLPDHDGTRHGNLDAAFVADLCDRRRGLGADGVIRVIRSEALGTLPVEWGTDAEWFMDYRNADGSISEMCGNGIRVFALHLAQEGLVDAEHPIPIGTRDGIKTVSLIEPSTGSGQATELISVDMGSPEILETSKVSIDDRAWEAQHIATGNPHAVVFVDRLSDAGTLFDEPEYDQDTYPDGVNIEFVVRQGANHVAMRVHERGSGETRSCGTGACAVGVAAAIADEADRPVTYQVDVPGGTVHVTWTADNRMILAGPAVIVARGDMEWLV